MLTGLPVMGKDSQSSSTTSAELPPGAPQIVSLFEGGHRDLDEIVGGHQLGPDCCSRRRIGLEHSDVSLVHRGKVSSVGEPDLPGDDIGHVNAATPQKVLDVGEDGARLSEDVATRRL